MYRLLLLIILSFQTDFLEDLKWENRVILLFTNSIENELVQSQLSTFKEKKEGLSERDLQVFIVEEDAVVTVSGREVRNAVAASLRSKFRINSAAFTFILIGKDGGVKLKENFNVSTDRLFDLIDSMPMRRKEMKDDY